MDTRRIIKVDFGHIRDFDEVEAVIPNDVVIIERVLGVLKHTYTQSFESNLDYLNMRLFYPHFSQKEEAIVPVLYSQNTRLQKHAIPTNIPIQYNNSMMKLKMFFNRHNEYVNLSVYLICKTKK